MANLKIIALIWLLLLSAITEVRMLQRVEGRDSVVDVEYKHFLKQKDKKDACRKIDDSVKKYMYLFQYGV